MIIYSPNMLKTYQTCPKKYFFKYVENINVPTSFMPFEKGKKIHALANYYLKGTNIARIEATLNQEENELWTRLKANEFFQKEYFKSEYQISCKNADFWIGGRLDAVVKDIQNYYILDYKTGAIPKNPQYDYQTMVYLLCLDKLLEKYESLSFIYINLKENKNYKINFNEELKQKYKIQLEQICSKITSNSLYKQDLTNCQHCEYKNICSRI